MSAGGSGGGYSHESKRLLLSFTRYDMYRHLCHVNTNRLEAMERLRALLYDKVDVGISRPDLARISILLGVNNRGWGVFVGVGVGEGPIYYLPPPLQKT